MCIPFKIVLSSLLAPTCSHSWQQRPTNSCCFAGFERARLPSFLRLGFHLFLWSYNRFSVTFLLLWGSCGVSSGFLLEFLWDLILEFKVQQGFINISLLFSSTWSTWPLPKMNSKKDSSTLDYDEVRLHPSLCPKCKSLTVSILLGAHSHWSVWAIPVENIFPP